MENATPVNIFSEIKEKYLSFILTTVCRDNQKLYEELNKIFLDNELIWKDLIVQATAKYKSIEDTQIKETSFIKEVKESILDQYKINKPPYVHQLLAWKKILSNHNCIIATGTGSGKTEAFLYPVIDHCMNNKLDNVQAIIIYPLKALANDQGNRLGYMLDSINKKYKCKIKWGILDGDTGKRKPSGYSSEIFSKDEMIEHPPNILITNYVMLERILLNPAYRSVLSNSKIKYLILDEIHYYRGAQGIDVSLLIRRLQFFLSQIQDISQIRYVGTSATLGNPSSEEVSSFLSKLFNVKFLKDSIITPVFDEVYENNSLFKPKYLKELSDLEKKELPANRNIRAHAYFCAPNPFFRCLKCNKIFTKHKPQCDNCKSNLIFEIMTCRQCGTEYFKFPFAKPTIETNEVNLNSLDVLGTLESFNSLGDQEKFNDLIFSKDSHNNSKTLKMCIKCLNLYPAYIEKCISCDNKDFVEIYPVENKEKHTIITKENSNDDYCPACGFYEPRKSLIAPISKLSDENCSHIVFDEFFMALSPEKRKLLIFTDNVQRTSKFAREIEETHLKKVVRAELHRKIEGLSEPISLSKLVFETMDSIKRKTNVNEYLELNLRKEIYEELFGSGRKVGSLANRQLFNIGINGIENFAEKDDLLKIFEVFKNEKQIRSYYEILRKEEVQFTRKFLDYKDLIKKIHRHIHNLQRKQIKGENFDRATALLKLLYEKGFINEDEGKYFLKDEFIIVSKGNPVINTNNYYDEWKNIQDMPILKSNIDTGKTDAKMRSEIESDFKEKNISVNFLVATPTLELGIDIGDLDVVGLLYAPPSPAQYTQRVGRAGRSGQSTIAVTYLSKRTLDASYFFDPKSLVEGIILPPSFNIELEIPIKKSLFSLFFYFTLHHTNFRKEREGLAWDKIQNWEINFNKIKELWHLYDKPFKVFLDKYFEISNIKINTENLIEEWIIKFEEFLEIQKYLNREHRSHSEIFNYFQQAGLLPDYAFGSGGAVVAVTYMDPIVGFNLREVCPPSTLDFNKSRFSCYKIRLFPAYLLKSIAENFKQCTKCGEIISIKNEYNHCPLCSNPFVIENKKIIEPKLIEARRSTFSLTQKTVKWKNYAIDLPTNIEYVNNKLSKPFNCDIGMFFESVRIDNIDKNYKLCGKCGEFYDPKETKKSETCTHISTNWVIGSKFKTRALLLNFPEGTLSDNITLLNALIAAATMESGCEDGEINGWIMNNTSKMIFFDDVEGGVGFVDVMSKNFKSIISQAIRLCKQDCCEDGCLKCIGSFRRQGNLDALKKRNIIQTLELFLK